VRSTLGIHQRLISSDELGDTVTGIGQAADQFFARIGADTKRKHCNQPRTRQGVYKTSTCSRASRVFVPRVWRDCWSIKATHSEVLKTSPSCKDQSYELLVPNGLIAS
jgi:hypothetical protein